MGVGDLWVVYDVCVLGDVDMRVLCLSRGLGNVYKGQVYVMGVCLLCVYVYCVRVCMLCVCVCYACVYVMRVCMLCVCVGHGSVYVTVSYNHLTLLTSYPA